MRKAGGGSERATSRAGFVTRTVEDNADNPAEIKDLTVAVRWQTYDGRWHTRQFGAIYARNGLYDYFYTIAHP